MKPLSGMRVIEMGTVVLAPYAAQLMAELGAEVVKIERLGGDSTRNHGAKRHPGMASLFLNSNRGKKSVAIDVKHPEGYAALVRLVDKADVFLHNMRFDAADRLGVGYERLRERNPRLIYCATYGYGANGRAAKRPAYDDIIQSVSGVAGLRQRIDGIPAYSPTIIADKTTALFVVIGVLGAVAERFTTGQGKQLEVAMLETMVHFLSIEHLNGLTWLPPAGPSGYVRLLNAWRRPHKTMDGYLAVMPHSEKQWKKFFTIVGREDVLTDPRFATPELRAGNVDALYIEVSKVLPTRTSAAWSEIFLNHDVPFGLVNSLEDLIEDGHLKDVGFWHEFEHPTEGRMRAPSFPVRDGGPKGDATPVTIAPTLGQHTLEVLEGAGYSPAQLQEMVRQGVIGTQWDEKARPASKEA